MVFFFIDLSSDLGNVCNYLLDTLCLYFYICNCSANSPGDWFTKRPVQNSLLATKCFKFSWSLFEWRHKPFPHSPSIVLLRKLTLSLFNFYKFLSWDTELVPLRFQNVIYGFNTRRGDDDDDGKIHFQSTHISPASFDI